MLAALGLLLGTAAFIYYLIKSYSHRNSDYWSKQDVTTLKNDLTIVDIFTGKRAPVDFDLDYYKHLGEEKFGGCMEFGEPMLFVKDLDLVKNIFVKDFDHFTDRRDFIETDPLMGKGLFFLRGQEWKDMRSFLSPTFTSGKIRRMFHYFEHSSNKLLSYMDKFHTKTDGGYKVLMPDIANRFTLDVIGATAFGMEVDCLNSVDSVFLKMAIRSSDFDLTRIIKFGIMTRFPKLGNFLKLTVFDSELTQFYVQMLTHAFRARDVSSKEQRDDFLQLVKEAAEGKLKDDEIVDPTESKGSPANDDRRVKVQLTENMAIQQAFLFFFAGFDTVASTIGETCYLLAAHQEIQEKVFEEVEKVMESSNGKITYENANQLEYLDMTISEVLRLYPIVTRVERKCTMDYPIPDTDIIIPKEMIVSIPAEGIHLDEKYYPDPTTFDPLRFSAENKAQRNAYAYMPFGIGPRACIGMRFALIEVKVAVALLIKSFKILPTEKTPIPVKMQKDIGFYRTPKDLELKLVPRK